MSPDQFRQLAMNSRELDRTLGFNIQDIEASLMDRARIHRPQGHLWSLGQGLHNGSQTWIGLDSETLQTPYPELIEMLELLKLKGSEHIIDLGAGYGRLGVVLHFLSPQATFLGLEIVPERVVEGTRVLKLLGSSHSLITKDLTEENFVLPIADIYFLYDFGEVSHIRKILNQLGNCEHGFKLIARGKGTRSLVDLEFPWLSDVHPVIRRENFAIYSSVSF